MEKRDTREEDPSKKNEAKPGRRPKGDVARDVAHCDPSVSHTVAMLAAPDKELNTQTQQPNTIGTHDV
jgi:hypothetical protein